METGIFPLSFSAIAVLLAGVVRGYCGFGFSMICVTALSLIFPPAKIVPVILALEVAASAALLPRAWDRIDWRSLTRLSVGVLLGIPAGVYLLANVPDGPMRAAIALVVICLVILMWRGVGFRQMPGRLHTMATGLISGVLNGGSAMGGPPVILFYFSSPAGAAVSRASLIAYFFLTDILAFGVSMVHGLVTLDTGLYSLILLFPLLAGTGLGSRWFARSQEKDFRQKVLMLLAVLSLAALIRAVWG